LGQLLAAFIGILSYGLSTLNGKGGLEGWRWIYLVPGLITVALSFPVWFLVCEFREMAKWLKPDELDRLREWLAEDRAEILEERLTFRRALTALEDWKVWLLTSLLFFLTAAAYTMSFFTPTILSSIGFSVALSARSLSHRHTLPPVLRTSPQVWPLTRCTCAAPLSSAHVVLTMVGFGLISWGSQHWREDDRNLLFHH
jgi:hypothetical protein